MPDEWGGMTGGGVKADSPRRRRTGAWPLAAAALALALLAALIWRLGDRGPLVAAPDEADDERIATVAYHVDAREWPQGRRPRLCEIIHHYGLGQEALAATLYLNRRSGQCAPAAKAVLPGETVPLAVWAPPEFEHCEKEAMRCP